MLRQPVRRIRKDRVGASHAVYFADLNCGERCVLRVVVHATEDISVEVWTAERCRERGVPVPEVLAFEAHPRDGLPTIPVTGFGPLARSGDSYSGTESSLWTHVDREVRGALDQLSEDVLPPAQKERIYARFAGAREALDRPAAVACHGDYRLKNVVLARDDGRWRVSAVLDFEMAHAGDPAYDLAYFFYSLRGKPWREADVAATCEGSGVSFPLPEALGRRVLLYQLYAAISHLWWEVSFDDKEGTQSVLGRIAEFEGALDA